EPARRRRGAALPLPVRRADESSATPGGTAPLPRDVQRTGQRAGPAGLPPRHAGLVQQCPRLADDDNRPDHRRPATEVAMSTVGAAPARHRTDARGAARDRRPRRADSRTGPSVRADGADSTVLGLTRVLAVLCCLLAPVPGLGHSVTLGAPLGLLVLPSTVRWLSPRLHRALAVALVATVVTAPVVSLVALAVAPDRSFELREFAKELG